MIHIIANYFSKDTLRIVKDFVSTVYKVVEKDRYYTYLDAAIISKKINNILFNRPVSSEDNFDTVTYLDKNNTYQVDDLFLLLSQYVEQDIYKLTGVSYTEYKHMTPLEKNLFLEYVIHKNEIENIRYEELNKEENNNNNDNLFDYYGV